MLRGLQTPIASNQLGLILQLETPLTPSTKPSLFARLEEVTSNQADNEQHPACNAIDRYHPGPMPPISDASPTSIFDHIDLALIREWDTHLGGKLITIPFDPEVRIIEYHNYYHTRILTAVTEIITTQEASIAAPRQSKKVASKSKIPTSFLIYNITHKQADFMLQRKVWSSRAITFRVALLAMTCPDFLFAIKHLSTIRVKDVFPIVMGVWNSDKTRNFVTALINSTPEHKRAKTAHDIDRLLSSMNLSRLDMKEPGNNLCLCFNLYADSSDFTNDKTWDRLHSFLLDADYISPMEADPATTEQIPFICTCCHGVDHPRGLCPFPVLTGWNGPKRDHTNPFQRRTGGRMSGPFDCQPQRPRFMACN
ncbi:hypothetical protein V8E53_011839 [Lactarius tabidus]